MRFSGKDSVLAIVNFAYGKNEAEILMPAGASLLWKNQFSGVTCKLENSRIKLSMVPLDFLMLVPSSEKEMQ